MKGKPILTLKSKCFPIPQSLFLISFSSVQFDHSVMSDSLLPHGLQHARPPCPSPTPRVYSNLCPSSQWCHPTISSSVVPFSSYLQSSPASGSFQISHFFASGGQSIKVESIGAKVFSNIEVDKTKIKIEKEGFRFCKFCLNISNEKHSYW